MDQGRFLPAAIAIFRGILMELLAVDRCSIVGFLEAPISTAESPTTGVSIRLSFARECSTDAKGFNQTAERTRKLILEAARARAAVN
jgi:hypothetical protein